MLFQTIVAVLATTNQYHLIFEWFKNTDLVRTDKALVIQDLFTAFCQVLLSRLKLLVEDSYQNLIA